MLFESTGQFWIALVFLWFGFCCGIVDHIIKAVQFGINKKFLYPCFDMIRAFLFGFCYFACSILVLYGQIRLYSFLIFIAGFLIELKILRKLVAKLFMFLYNYSVNKVKNRKEKLNYAKNRK